MIISLGIDSILDDLGALYTDYAGPEYGIFPNMRVLYQTRTACRPVDQQNTHINLFIAWLTESVMC